MAVRVVGGSWGARGAGGLLCRLSVCTVKGYSRGTAVFWGGAEARARPRPLLPLTPAPRTEIFFSPDFFFFFFFCVSTQFIY